jgi:DNA-binding sugar fermentation-stimulating protein
MCYVIPVYRAAFYEAKKNGVEMHAIQVTWDKHGAATYIGELFVI